MVNRSSLNISSARVLMRGSIAFLALVLFASVSFADPVVYTDDSVPTGTISIGADGVEFQISGEKSYGSTMSGSGSLYKTGGGTLTLTNGGSNFTGNVDINAGAIKITPQLSGSNSALGKVQANRTITINSGAELILNNQDIFTNAHNANPILFVLDGGTISNSGEFYDYLTNVTFKNGGQINATNGNPTWKAFKLHNVTVERSDRDDRSPATITAVAGMANATIAFGDISDVIKVRDNNSVSTVNVGEITSADGSVDDASDLIISAVIADPVHTTKNAVTNASQIVKAGAGTMELTAANTIKGTTTINAGKIKLSGDGTLGTGAVVNNATLELSYGSDKTFSNTVSGTGDLIKTGSGTLTLSSRNSSFTGDLYLNEGKIKVSAQRSGSNSPFGKVQEGRSIYVNSGTELIFAYQDLFSDAHNNNPVTIVVDGGKVSNSGAYYNFLQHVTLKNGGNIHAANGNSTWKAYKFQNINVLSNTDGSAAKVTTITGANNTDAVICFGTKSEDVATTQSKIHVEDITASASSDLLISAKIIDAITFRDGTQTACEIVKTGAGTLELNNLNSSYSGNLTINGGTLKISAGSSADNRTASALGASNVARTVTINNGAVLELAAQDVICDTHATSQIAYVVDGGQITNSGAFFNFLHNVTLKNGGNVNASDGNANWAAYKIQNLRVERNSNNTAAPAATLTAANDTRAVFTFGPITDELDTVPAVIYVEDVTNPNRSTDDLSDLVISAKIVNPSITGTAKKASEIVKSGAGMLEITAANAYTGKTTISDGSVKLSGDGTLGTGEIVNNSTLEFAHESDQALSNAISGTGAVTKTGAGTLSLSGAYTNTGETTVSAGTMQMTGGALTALANKTAGPITVESDAALEFNANVRVAPVKLSFSDSNKIVSTGEVIKTGDGALQLYEAAGGAIDIRSLTVSSGRVDLLGYMTGGITLEPNSVFSPGNSSSASVSDVPAVVGHRGNSSVAPENTLSAFRSCIESGAQGAECDVYRTKDGYLVLQHDSTLSRNVRDANGNPVTGRIADYTLDELLTMDFGVWKGEEFRGEKVATLDQYLDLLNGTNCAPVIELKQDGLEADTIAAIRERGMEKETTIIAFSENAIKECRRLAPEIKAAWLCTKNSSETVDQYADRIIATLGELDTTYVDMEAAPITPEMIQKLHDNGITVMTWTVDNPDRVNALYGMGIDSVTTNVPVTGIELLDYMIGPGADNSIGQASFGDDFILKEGATLLLEFDETGADSLLVSGNTEFEEGSFITLALAEGASPVPGQQLSFQLSLDIDSFENATLSYPSYLAGIGYDPSTGILSAYIDANAIPEPSTWALMILGVVFWSATACRRFHFQKRR